MEKFRSIKAFRDYEARSKGARSEVLDPLRLMELLKGKPDGMRIIAISRELGVAQGQVTDAVRILENKHLVKVLDDGERVEIA